MNIPLAYLKKNWLWLIVNCIVFALFMWSLWRLWNAPYGTRPSLFSSGENRNIGLFTGKVALVMLVLSLACTPLSRVLKWNRVIAVRKPLGLWSFVFAVLHMLITLTGTSFRSDLVAWQTVGNTIWLGWTYGPWNGYVAWGKMPYAMMGFYAFVLLMPLVLTSNRRAMRLLGKNWKRLHRLVYLIALLAIWHYLWRGFHQSNWGVPSGELVEGLVQPLLFAVVVGTFLLVRMPVVRKRLRSK